MDYELAKKLKEANFPNKNIYFIEEIPDSYINDTLVKGSPSRWENLPTLEELIEACGGGFEGLVKSDNEWIAYSYDKVYGMSIISVFFLGKNPTEAVAKLWLELNKE